MASHYSLSGWLIEKGELYFKVQYHWWEPTGVGSHLQLIICSVSLCGCSDHIKDIAGDCTVPVPDGPDLALPITGSRTINQTQSRVDKKSL